MTVVLRKVFVNGFYRVNAGFFLVVIGLCGGIMGGREHMALAQFFVGSPVLLLIPVACWTLYGYKLINFNRLSLTRSENTFAFQMGSLTQKELWFRLLSPTTQQLAPVWLYALFLLFVSADQRQWESIAEIILFLILLTGWIVRDQVIHISNPDQGKTTSRWGIDYHRLFIKPPFTFYSFWITRRQPLLVLGTKLFNIVLIHVACLLYVGESYDERLLAMMWSLVMAGNLAIVFHYHRFENFDLGMLRGLPLSLLQRGWLFIKSIAPLLLPELVTLMIRYPDQLGFQYTVGLLLFTAGACLYAYASLFRRDISLEDFLQHFLVLTMLWIVLILFKLPLPALALMQITAAIYLIRRDYYRFTYDAETPK